VGGRLRCDPGAWKDAQSLAYEWLRGDRPIPGATAARYRVAPADGGHPLSCRVTARATDGSRTTATSKRARAQLGLTVRHIAIDVAGGASASLQCARSERRCAGTLQVLIAGRAVALGHFALSAPGGIARFAVVAGAHRGAGGGVATVRIAYRNRAGAARIVLRRLVLRG
jgi:hypothetical protein